MYNHDQQQQTECKTCKYKNYFLCLSLNVRTIAERRI